MKMSRKIRQLRYWYFTYTFCHIHDIGHEDVVRLLIGLGANVNAKKTDGSSALHEASSYGNYYLNYIACTIVQCTSLLFENSMFIQRLISKIGQVNIIRLLIEKGAEINSEGHDKWTPLSKAAHSGNSQKFH